MCPLSVTYSVCNFDRFKVAILLRLMNQTTQRDSLTIRPRDDLNKIHHELRICGESVCLLSVGLVDHLYESRHPGDDVATLNVQVVDSGRLLAGEGAEHGGGGGGHDAVACCLLILPGEGEGVNPPDGINGSP